jgi:site-specific recombinase XerD
MNGTEQWVLDVRYGKTRKRKYFKNHQLAIAAKNKVESDIKKNTEMFAKYSPEERMQMVLAYGKAKDMGCTLDDAIAALKIRVATRKPDLNLEKLVDLCIEGKEAAGCRPRTISTMSSTLYRFIENRKRQHLDDISSNDIRSWLLDGPWESTTRNTKLTDIKTFFSWAVAGDYTEANPAARVKKFKATPGEEQRKEEAEDELPRILTPAQVKCLLSAAKKDDPKLAAYIAILFFAGLRPEREAAGVREQDIMFEDKLLHVRKRKAKDRQARYIEMEPNLVAWLNWKKGDLPPSNLRHRWDSVRRKCNLYGSGVWPHDAARHSFASHYLVVHGAKKTIDALGHGDYEMLFKHYRSLVKPKQAKEYFGIRP